MPAAFVTGGAGAIGGATAKRLLVAGWDVAVCDLHDGAPAGALGLVADITDYAALDAALDRAIDAFDGLDLLVNNAGIEVRAPLADHDDDTWERVLTINALAADHAARHTAAALQARRGAIVNVASIAVIGMGGQVAYDTSKGSLLGLTQELADALPRVRVNTVCPGFIDTPMLHAAGLGPIAEQVTRRLPVARLGRPEEVAAVIGWLAVAEGVTRQCLFVDGGMVRPPWCIHV